MRTLIINEMNLINIVDLRSIEFLSKMESLYRFGIRFLIFLLANHNV